MSTVHQFTTPMGFCPGQGPMSNDTSLLRSQIKLLLGGNCQVATYQHQRVTEVSGAFLGNDFHNNVSSAGSTEGFPVINGYGSCSAVDGVPCTGCNSEDLVPVPTVALPGTGSCVDVINASFAPGFSFTLGNFTGFYNKFAQLNDSVSLLLQWGTFCTTEVFELVVIFDGKIPISWGVLTDSGGFGFRTPTKQPFPQAFTSFEMVIHSVTNNIYYQTSPRLLYTL